MSNQELPEFSKSYHTHVPKLELGDSKAGESKKDTEDLEAERRRLIEQLRELEASTGKALLPHDKDAPENAADRLRRGWESLNPEQRAERERQLRGLVDLTIEINGMSFDENAKVVKLGKIFHKPEPDPKIDEILKGFGINAGNIVAYSRRLREFSLNDIVIRDCLLHASGIRLRENNDIDVAKELLGGQRFVFIDATDETRYRVVWYDGENGIFRDEITGFSLFDDPEVFKDFKDPEIRLTALEAGMETKDGKLIIERKPWQRDEDIWKFMQKQGIDPYRFLITNPQNPTELNLAKLKDGFFLDNDTEVLKPGVPYKILFTAREGIEYTNDETIQFSEMGKDAEGRSMMSATITRNKDTKPKELADKLKQFKLSLTDLVISEFTEEGLRLRHAKYQTRFEFSSSVDDPKDDTHESTLLAGRIYEIPLTLGDYKGEPKKLSEEVSLREATPGAPPVIEIKGKNGEIKTTGAELRQMFTEVTGLVLDKVIVKPINPASKAHAGIYIWDFGPHSPQDKRDGLAFKNPDEKLFLPSITPDGERPTVFGRLAFRHEDANEGYIILPLRFHKATKEQAAESK